jgi:hypothetical protein
LWIFSSYRYLYRDWVQLMVAGKPKPKSRLNLQRATRRSASLRQPTVNLD